MIEFFNRILAKMWRITKKILLVIGALFVVGFIITLFTVGGPEQANKASDGDKAAQAEEPKVKEPKKPSKKEGVILDGAFSLSKGYAHLKQVQRTGYEQIFAQGKCPKLEYSDVSTLQGTKADPVIFYTCEQKGQLNNIFLKVSDIKSGKAKVQEPPKQSWAYEQCTDGVKQRLQYPSTFRKPKISTRTWNNGRRAVYIKAKAKNAFNLEIEISATCYFTPTGNKDTNQFDVEVNVQEE